MNNETFDAVILADGDFPSHPLPLSVLRAAPLLVCCDGAVRHAPQADAVVGDGDSVPDALRDRLIQIDEQEDNDLTKATRYCVQRGCRHIAYLGCTGGREDHTLGNISLLVRYRRQYDLRPTLFTDYGTFVSAEGTATFDSFPGQQVSIFNFGCSRISSEGLKWAAYAYQELWQGTLNEALASQFSMETDGFYLVYRTYAAKTPSSGQKSL